MKLKSHKSTQKRVKITGRGKLKTRKIGTRHLLMQKSKRQKKLSTNGMILNAKDTSNLKKRLPYAF
jgi:large subunit ribosomal protein L35